MSLRTHGAYLNDAIRRRVGQCVRRTPPGGLSNERAGQLLALGHPKNAAWLQQGYPLEQYYTNKSFTVVRLGLEGPLCYGVVYRHDWRWYWYRADAAFVRGLAISTFNRDPIREDFPEVFEENL